MGRESLVITTVCSDNHFQYFIPLFICAAKFSYPEADVKVFLRGEAKYKMFDVYERQFMDYPNSTSLCNSLRYLIPDDAIKDYDYWFSTDVDTLVLKPPIDHVAFYKKVMQETGLPYAAARGPLTRPRRKEAPNGWTGHFTRLASGSVMFKTKEFLNVTRGHRKAYRERLKQGLPEPFDHAKPGCYREYDEVMLYRIIHGSGLRTPTQKNKFTNGRHADTKYRGLHLGDFKFSKRCHNARKMRSLLDNSIVSQFVELEKTKEWKAACKMACNDEDVARMIKKARKYIGKRTQRPV